MESNKRSEEHSLIMGEISSIQDNRKETFVCSELYCHNVTQTITNYYCSLLSSIHSVTCKNRKHFFPQLMLNDKCYILNEDQISALHNSST